MRQRNWSRRRRVAVLLFLPTLVSGFTPNQQQRQQQQNRRYYHLNKAKQTKALLPPDPFSLLKSVSSSSPSFSPSSFKKLSNARLIAAATRAGAVRGVRNGSSTTRLYLGFMEFDLLGFYEFLVSASGIAYLLFLLSSESDSDDDDFENNSDESDDDDGNSKNPSDLKRLELQALREQLNKLSMEPLQEIDDRGMDRITRIWWKGTRYTSTRPGDDSLPRKPGDPVSAGMRSYLETLGAGPIQIARRRPKKALYAPSGGSSKWKSADDNSYLGVLSTTATTPGEPLPSYAPQTALPAPVPVKPLDFVNAPAPTPVVVPPAPALAVILEPSPPLVVPFASAQTAAPAAERAVVSPTPPGTTSVYNTPYTATTALDKISSGGLYRDTLAVASASATQKKVLSYSPYQSSWKKTTTPVSDSSYTEGALDKEGATVPSSWSYEAPPVTVSQPPAPNTPTYSAQSATIDKTSSDGSYLNALAGPGANQGKISSCAPSTSSWKTKTAAESDSSYLGALNNLGTTEASPPTVAVPVSSGMQSYMEKLGPGPVSIAARRKAALYLPSGVSTKWKSAIDNSYLGSLMPPTRSLPTFAPQNAPPMEIKSFADAPPPVTVPPTPALQVVELPPRVAVPGVSEQPTVLAFEKPVASHTSTATLYKAPVATAVYTTSSGVSYCGPATGAVPPKPSSYAPVKSSWKTTTGFSDTSYLGALSKPGATIALSSSYEDVTFPEPPVVASYSAPPSTTDDKTSWDGSYRGTLVDAVPPPALQVVELPPEQPAVPALVAPVVYPTSTATLYSPPTATAVGKTSSGRSFLDALAGPATPQPSLRKMTTAFSATSYLGSLSKPGASMALSSSYENVTFPEPPVVASYSAPSTTNDETSWDGAYRGTLVDATDDASRTKGSSSYAPYQSSWKATSAAVS